MEYFLGTLTFLFGSAIGSFLAVIVGRYNTGLAFFKGRSFCFSCNTEIQNRDLFPIFSFLILKGKCRYCYSKIPKETLFTEIFMGFLAVLAFLISGQNLLLFSILLVIFAVILLITMYDFKHFIIPDRFLFYLFLLSVIYNFIYKIDDFTSIIYLILSGIILALPFFFIFYISKGLWIGFGDVKYMLVIGFFLGLASGVSAVILSFWIGAIFSVSLLMIQKLKINLPFLENRLTIKSEIPFGPFLSLGLILSFYFNLDLFHINDLLALFIK